MAVGQAVPQRRAKIRIEENMIQLNSSASLSAFRSFPHAFMSHEQGTEMKEL